MRRNLNRITPLVLCTTLAALAPSAAQATNGCFSHGYGVKAQGLAGVGIALPQDAVGSGELSGFLAIAPGKTVHGSGSIPPGLPPGGLGGGEANVRLKEAIFGLSYSWKL